jgi:hypothetical protein
MSCYVPKYAMFTGPLDSGLVSQIICIANASLAQRKKPHLCTICASDPSFFSGQPTTNSCCCTCWVTFREVIHFEPRSFSELQSTPTSVAFLFFKTPIDPLEHRNLFRPISRKLN